MTSIIYFKLTETKMSVDWRIGEVEEVKVGQDGYVREVNLAIRTCRVVNLQIGCSGVSTGQSET